MEPVSTVIIEPCGDTGMIIQSVKDIVYSNGVDTESNNAIEEKFLVLTNTSEYNNRHQVTLMETTNINSMEHAGNSGGFTELCRVCANTSNHMIPIFDGEGAQHYLCSKIHKYLPIHISEDDTLPLHICYQCASTLLAWHDLLEGCVNAEQKLLQMQAKLNSQEEEKLISTVSESGVNANAMKDDQVVEPNVNEIQLLSERPIERNNDASGKQNATNDNRWQTTGVMVLQTIEIDKSSNKEGERVDCSEYRTNFCSTKFLQPSAETKMELRCTSNNSKNVEISEQTSENRSNAEFHEMTQTISNNILINSEREFINKAKTIINDKVVFHCDQCDKQILTRHGFIRHIRIHSGDRPCVCARCNKTFRVKQDLTRHIRDVHECLKRYICDICERAFANKNARDDHRRIHTGEKPYACQQCQKTFRTLNSLYIHNRSHTNYNPHQCSICGNCFRNKQRLNNHMTTHTGVKAFPCEYCGKTFSVKSESVRHRMVHTVEKPFECVICGMKFAQKRYIRNHINLHHKEQSSKLLARLNVKLD